MINAAHNKGHKIHFSIKKNAEFSRKKNSQLVGFEPTLTE